MALLCPCGSGVPYAACCGPLHRGRGAGSPTAATAEQLMRSRYSAFALGRVDYLLASWHPTTRPPTLEVDEDIRWDRLEIVGSTGGGEAERTGTVEFIAHFWDAVGRPGSQREASTFLREDGQWFYVGEVDE